MGWVKSQSPSAGVGTAPGRCTSCDSLARAQANGRVGPRVLDEALSSMVAYSGRLDEPAPHNDGYQDPFLAHPEGPSLSRRVALEELAWALTQLAGEVGMGAAEAARCRPLPTYKNRWEEFKVDMAREIRSAMRREVSFSDHGHPEVLVSLPFVLPTAIKLRRRCSQRRTYGPLAAFWWPYRYSGGPLRDVALETAVVVIIVGSAMVAWGVTTYGLTSALWWRWACGGLATAALGLVGAISLAGDVEDWGDAIEVPFLDLFRNSVPDPYPIAYPVAPGPLLGWTWAGEIRKVTCPCCFPHGGPGRGANTYAAAEAFYEWFSLVPPPEWNGGMWRHLTPGHLTGGGYPSRPRPHTGRGGPIGDTSHRLHRYLATHSWWRRWASLGREHRRRAMAQRAAVRAARRGRLAPPLAALRRLWRGVGGAICATTTCTKTLG